MKFKIGDEVKLISSRWGDYAENPFWGGRLGKIEGNVISIYGRTDFSLKVEWSNGKSNSYDESDLDFVSAKKDEVIYE